MNLQVRMLRAALRVAAEALQAVPTTCRFHGAAFDRAGTQGGRPRCGSCVQPWLATTALTAINEVLTADPITEPTPPAGGGRPDPGA